MTAINNYILLPREVEETISDLPPHVREIWMYFLRRANRGEDENLEIGQLATSYSEIIHDLSWKVGFRREYYKKHHCATAVEILTRRTMILPMRRTGKLIVTICNFDSYMPEKRHETSNETSNETNREAVKKQASLMRKLDTQKKRDYRKMFLSEVVAEEHNLNKEHVDITKAFQELFISNLKEAGASTRQVMEAKGAWIDPIRLAIEKDGYSVDDFRDVFRFLKKDAFWKSNILSTSKLRQQMSRLKIKINEDSKHSSTAGKGYKRESFTDEELAEQIRQGAARAIANASSEASY